MSTQVLAADLAKAGMRQLSLKEKLAYGLGAVSYTHLDRRPCAVPFAPPHWDSPRSG